MQKLMIFGREVELDDDVAARWLKTELAIDKARTVRIAQRGYFTTRSPAALTLSKRVERELDRLLEDLNGTAPTAPTLL